MLVCIKYRFLHFNSIYSLIYFNGSSHQSTTILYNPLRLCTIIATKKIEASNAGQITSPKSLINMQKDMKVCFHSGSMFCVLTFEQFLFFNGSFHQSIMRLYNSLILSTVIAVKSIQTTNVGHITKPEKPH